MTHANKILLALALCSGALAAPADPSSSSAAKPAATGAADGGEFHLLFSDWDACLSTTYDEAKGTVNYTDWPTPIIPTKVCDGEKPYELWSVKNGKIVQKSGGKEYCLTCAPGSEDPNAVYVVDCEDEEAKANQGFKVQLQDTCDDPDGAECPHQIVAPDGRCITGPSKEDDTDEVTLAACDKKNVLQGWNKRAKSHHTEKE